MPIPVPPPPVRPPEEQDVRTQMREVFPETPAPATVAAPDQMRSARPAVVAVEAPVGRPPIPPPPILREPQPSFWERHPDLEKFIGENLINKIGITVLVIGIGLLLRYAIGKGMISETGRTLIGLFAGGVLVFFAHRLRRSFRAFSSVLVAGGIAVFYFTIATAFHQYHLIGQTAAFAVMIMITALAVALTLAYDRKELAVISLLGGFATPFMVSTGEGNFRVLFTYLLILNIGMLVLANFKKWHVINVISFTLTVLLFGSWAVGPYEDLVPRPALLGFAFAAGFFLVFFLMNLRYNLKHSKAFTALDHALLLINTAAFYAAGMYLLGDLQLRVKGLFTILLGAFYMGFALYFHRREGIPRDLQLLLIGLVLTFISLAAPVQLEGNYITLFWAAEAVLLLWFGQRTGIRLIERTSMLINVLMLVSLWLDFQQVYYYSEEVLRPVLNKGWITGMATVISLAGTTILLDRKGDRREIFPEVSWMLWRDGVAVMAIMILYLTNYLEIRHQLEKIYLSQVVDMALMAYTLLFLLLLDLSLRKAHQLWRNFLGFLFSIAGLIYITVFYASSRTAITIDVPGPGGEGTNLFHYASFVLMLLAATRLIRLIDVQIPRKANSRPIFLWSVSIFLVIFASQELDHAMILSKGSIHALDGARRVGYPILWGVSSFLFMWYGMRRRIRLMRIIGLCLFGITLIKLFLFDLGQLSEGGRVAAFIVLGALLLVISFMYQKLKGLLIDEDPDATISATKG